MDAINLDILKQLQEYAKVYFDAIVEANTECGKCKFADGKYTAKDVEKWNYRQPEDDMFYEDITLESGTFKCKFPYRRIFQVLNDWENMCRAGKLKAVFEIGETEVKSAKVLTAEKTVLGAFKTKTMKLQRISGNWWRPVKLPKRGQVWLYHETNGVMHIGGRRVFTSELEDCPERIIAFCQKWTDEEFIKLISKFTPDEDSEFVGYYSHILELAGICNEPEHIATTSEVPQISTETPEVENEPREETKREQISAKCLYWDYSTQTIKERVNIMTKVTEHLYYIDNGGAFCTIARCLNGIYWEPQGNAELRREAFDAGNPEFAKILNELNAHQTVGDFVAQYESRVENGYYISEFNMELHKRIAAAIQPPQSPTIPETANYATEPTKRAQEPRNKPKRTVGVLLVYPPERIMQNVPRSVNCSTAYHIRGFTKMVFGPPIRGDCKTRIHARAKPPNIKRSDHITNFKPP